MANVEENSMGKFAGLRKKALGLVSVYQVNEYEKNSVAAISEQINEAAKNGENRIYVSGGLMDATLNLNLVSELNKEGFEVSLLDDSIMITWAKE